MPLAVKVLVIDGSAGVGAYVYVPAATASIIKTELEKMVKFLSKLKKYGVKHLFNHSNINLFEVTNG